jgi:hypothetical protein
MTPLKAKISRRGNCALDGSFGLDKRRRIVATLVPGTDLVPDMIELRPEGTRRPVQIALCDVYRSALRAQAARATLERARATKARKADARARRALDRAAAKLRQPLPA